MLSSLISDSWSLVSGLESEKEEACSPDWCQTEVHHQQPASVQTELLAPGWYAWCSAARRRSQECSRPSWHTGWSSGTDRSPQNTGSPEHDYTSQSVSQPASRSAQGHHLWLVPPVASSLCSHQFSAIALNSFIQLVQTIMQKLLPLRNWSMLPNDHVSLMSHWERLQPVQCSL